MCFPSYILARPHILTHTSSKARLYDFLKLTYPLTQHHLSLFGVSSQRQKTSPFRGLEHEGKMLQKQTPITGIPRGGGRARSLYATPPSPPPPPPPPPPGF